MRSTVCLLRSLFRLIIDIIDRRYADAVKQAQEQQQRVYEAEMPRILAELEVRTPLGRLC
jgi:hypothetical protein